MDRPLILAKYIGAENTRYLHNILVENRLYFSDPSTFNDPFEMVPGLPRRKIFRPVILTPERQSAAAEVVENIKVDLWGKKISELKRYGVCCFSEVRDNIVMWANYAEKHAGICLLFSTEFKFFDGIMRVDYADGRPQMCFMDREKSKAIVSTKFRLWAYEKEWRIVRGRGGESYRYPPSSLKSIIFGCRCSGQDMDLVKRMCGNKKIRYQRACMSTREYRLDIVDL